MKASILSILAALSLLAPLAWQVASAQSFHFGNDLSYVNEMEDCGVTYMEGNTAKDPYQIFADHGGTLTRLRLWHTPTWYDNLNAGQRYSDLADVRKSILRAKAAGMQVLLDFHLSDNWADPSKQRVPAAWESVVGNLPLLKDSLHNYISQTLLSLHAEGLLPDMVQIGNETNKGILLSPQDDASGWVLDWNRNAQLFNTAISAVRAVETATGKSIKVALHCAGPADAGWLLEGFWSHGVTDFDVIGISYYWAWHQPTSIADCGNVVATLKQAYPGKQVMIFETGYIWTTQGNDSANNIINATHPAYSPASPANQRLWLEALTQEVINKGGAGVIYWESAWVSSTCWTQWGQGSHQEHATFFDFDNNLLDDGGIGWMSHQYDNLSPAPEAPDLRRFQAFADSNRRSLRLELAGFLAAKSLTVKMLNVEGRWVFSEKISAADASLTLGLPSLPAGVYFVALMENGEPVAVRRVYFQ